MKLPTPVAAALCSLLLLCCASGPAEATSQHAPMVSTAQAGAGGVRGAAVWRTTHQWIRALCLPLPLQRHHWARRRRTQQDTGTTNCERPSLGAGTAASQPPPARFLRQPFIFQALRLDLLLLPQNGTDEFQLAASFP